MSSLEPQFRRRWWPVRRRHTGEIGNQAGARFRVLAFRVAALAFLHRRAEIYLVEQIGVRFADAVAVGALGRNERCDDQEARLREQRCYLASAANIFAAVGGRKAEIRAEPIT